MIRLTAMTPEMYHSYYREYENDPDLYLDKDKYTAYTYSKEKVASRPPAAHLSSQRDNRFTTYYVFGQSYTTYYTSGQLSWGVFYHMGSRMELDVN